MKWFVAERQPRGLACIVPWEGMADLYRDATRHGGITNTKVSTLVKCENQSPRLWL